MNPEAEHVELKTSNQASSDSASTMANEYLRKQNEEALLGVPA